ncbi:MAG: methylmalonyl Co-A mutase-associated GTPase MeaB [Flavobacteriaceae bacterium]|nr:methylmalonyl Co-A mutase-associated GTPase MeaB [Flavobacteriaceae bacterium]
MSKKYLDKSAILRLQNKKAALPTAELFVEKIVSGDMAYLSRAITLVESSQPKHQKLAKQVINGCLPYSDKSVRIGITGVPGVGKSTFIEKYGLYLLEQKHKVAVLAVDPSSTLRGGSILGDKTRMQELSKSKNVYIRPSPAGNVLGGVARKTRETIMLCEAAGYDYIIVETVGTGQSETVVHSMVDFFLLLKLTGAGDDLQGIKRGILEMADAVVINKADGNNKTLSGLTKLKFERALHLFTAKESGWIVKTGVCSAIENNNIDIVYSWVDQYMKLTKNNGFFEKNRKQQLENWLFETIEYNLKTDFYNNTEVSSLLKKILIDIEKGNINPFEKANDLLEKYKNQ